MPADFDRYYGFTRYALELNELNPELKLLLPPTDTRLRPDQRYWHHTQYTRDANRTRNMHSKHKPCMQHTPTYMQTTHVIQLCINNCTPT